MRKPRLPFLYGFCLFVIIVTACSNFEEVKVGSPAGLRINRLRASEINLEVLLPIENPNNKKFKVTTIDLDVSLNEHYLGKIRNVDQVLIPGKSKDIYTLSLEIEMNNLLSSVFSVLNILASRRVKLEIKGFLKVRSGIFTMTIPVEEMDEVLIFKEFP